MIKLLALSIFFSFPVIAEISVVNINSIDKGREQSIKFRNTENTCDYYGQIQDISDKQKVIVVTQRICANIGATVNMFAQLHTPITIDSQWIPAGSKWTLR